MIYQESYNGVILRNRYVNQFHLLSKDYTSQSIYVLADDTKTILSANALLQGLYPLGTRPNINYNQELALPHGTNIIPIYTTAPDSYLIMGNMKNWGMAYCNKDFGLSYEIKNKLFNQLADNLQEVKQGKQKYKLIYYSGHDYTILWIMSLLGKPLEISPGFAARLQLELYKEDSDNYIVKIRYNGKFKRLPMMNGKDYCSLETFLNYTHSINTKFE